MQLVQPITATHEGVVHDVAYDFYGKRMASCSSIINFCPKTIKLVSGYAVLNGKQHQSPVWKVDWAHPEYGQLVASCSFDRTVVIWVPQTRRPAIGRGDHHGFVNVYEFKFTDMAQRRVTKFEASQKQLRLLGLRSFFSLLVVGA